MKIVIDARMYGLEHAGIGRYVLNLINQIEEIDKKNRYLILLRKNYYRRLKFKNPRFKKISCDIPHYSFKEQILLPLQLIKLKPNLVHFPHFNVPIFWWGRYLVTIHDLIKHQSRGKETTTKLSLFYWFKYLAYLLNIFSAVKRAQKIVTPSNWWKNQLVKRYHLKSEKVIVTYEGAEEFLNKKPSISGEKVMKKYGINKPFVIYTGNLYPHKNVLQLVKALINLNQGNHRLSLVVACARNIFLERFKHEVEKMRGLDLVVLAGFVPDGELIALYKEAETFITPSLLEGFGLPGLEAMAVGLPVISSKASCLPEIYGKAAVYFDPLDVDDMVKKIKMVIGDKKIRQLLIKRGFEQVKKYSWKKMTQQTLKIYDEIGTSL